MCAPASSGARNGGGTRAERSPCRLTPPRLTPPLPFSIVEPLWRQCGPGPSLAPARARAEPPAREDSMRHMRRFIVPLAALGLLVALLVSAGALAAQRRPLPASHPGSVAPGGGQIACRAGQPCLSPVVMTTANPGSLGNNFFATAVISASDAWAAGWKYELPPATARGPKAGCGCAHYALVEHWNGSIWSVVSHPDETLKDSQITGMAAIASKDVWAVGYYTNPVSGTSENHIEHWNGSIWSLVPSAPVPQSEILSAVAGRSSSDVWAVGSFYNASQGHRVTETKHWNGTSWSLIPSPPALEGTSSTTHSPQSPRLPLMTSGQLAPLILARLSSIGMAFSGALFPAQTPARTRISSSASAAAQRATSGRSALSTIRRVAH
jgi:hypothetical protein